MRMARIPEGATLILNPVSKAPGFRIGNVHVMAGVPKVMNAMMDEIAPTLSRGAAGAQPHHPLRRRRRATSPSR
jgi:molybdopterin-biosynthesis enzyme MoeA-like protein